MPKPSSLALAKRQIFAHFNKAQIGIYTEAHLVGILDREGPGWRVAPSTRKGEFIDFLTREGALKVHQFQAEEYNRTITRYTWGKISPYALALSLKSRGYLSHGTAAFLHNLSKRKPPMLHLNVEQSSKEAPSGGLTQDALDRVFRNKQRQSKYIFRAGRQAVMIIAGKNSDRLGVAPMPGPDSESLQVTNLERTLIDIVVRPSYAGGVGEVLKAYRAARDNVSVDKLLDILDELSYVYPYHQSIGFLMQTAGYGANEYAKLMAYPRNHDFYLTHEMQEPAHSDTWRLYYPSGLKLPGGAKSK